MRTSADTYAEFFQRGKDLVADGKHEEAIAEFTRSSEQQPNSFWPIYHRGESLWNLQRWDEAEANFRRANEMNGASFRVRFGLGKTLLALERWDETIEVLTLAKAIDIIPSVEALAGLQTILTMQGRTDDTTIADCTRTLIQTIVENPSYTPAYSLLGSIFERDGHVEAAMAIYQQARKHGVADDEINRRWEALQDPSSKTQVTGESRPDNSS